MCTRHPLQKGLFGSILCLSTLCGWANNHLPMNILFGAFSRLDNLWVCLTMFTLICTFNTVNQSRLWFLCLTARLTAAFRLQEMADFIWPFGDRTQPFQLKLNVKYRGRLRLRSFTKVVLLWVTSDYRFPEPPLLTIKMALDVNST